MLIWINENKTIYLICFVTLKQNHRDFSLWHSSKILASGVKEAEANTNLLDT